MTFGASFGAQRDAKRFAGCASLIPQIRSFWLRPCVEILRGQGPAGCSSSSKTSNISMRIRTSNIYMSTTSNIYNINTWCFRSPRGQAPWGEGNVVFILYIPQTSFSLWGSYLVLKELPKPFPPSKLPILYIFSSFAYKSSEILRKVSFS